MINNYSFPRGASANEFTERSNFPTISYNPQRDIARCIYQLRSEFHYLEVLAMLGDVSDAFRHVPVHEDAVHMFVFAIDSYIGINLSCRFRRCGSPLFYSLAGSAINDCMNCQCRYRSRQWTCIVFTAVCGATTNLHGTEQRESTRDANNALRKVMLTVLGSTAINMKKFTPWSATNKELDLLWNTVDGTVSIPLDMMDRALAQVDSVLSARKTSKADLAKLLGVFPHVATWFPSTRAFYQRAHMAMITMSPFTKHRITDVVVEDWRWFNAVLLHNERFNQVPVSQFADLASPTVHMYMDASNVWLWVLEPQTRELLRLWYTADALIALKDPDTKFNNVTDLQNAVLAAFVWGSHWLSDDRRNSTHVRLHIGNTSAVSWASRRLSHHPTAYLYNRPLSLVELQYRITLSAERVPGRLNTMADAESRAWSETNICGGSTSLRRVHASMLERQ
ncbi:hypothetical protein PHMEG_0003653 [Phytophthora megakarya]|uniref:Reverse transcriptase n=1 Tax=Phytophthora megakarya TaxID=4795 RepID=A0A225WVU3_9STRA|nr:hypothetical protein PHMEG_0003653 [Phytophthora megakarya]